MHIGYIGLGKMGKNMVLRLHEKGHAVIAYNRSPEPRAEVAKQGVATAESLEDLVAKLEPPRVVWLMVSHQAVDEFLNQLKKLLKPGDIVVEGGNSFYEQSVKRAQKFEKKKIHFLDVGVSGGPAGARNGACLMVGGPEEIYHRLVPVFMDLAVEGGFEHCGSAGAGHFVKMVHNGIEYGMMQAIGEGFEVLKKSNFNLNLKKVSGLYNHKSVIESRLVGWLKSAYEQHGEELEAISGSINHSGEGEWTVKTAKKLGVDVPIIKGSFKFRIQSKDKPSYTGKVVSALRNQFGGHDVKK